VRQQHEKILAAAEIDEQRIAALESPVPLPP